MKELIDRLRNFPRTTFSCSGRPAGYYADVETGCQIYHMCDGQGRQFTNICPNATLFQQRMLICDHWYMVNCDRAESQRDQPFVTEEERIYEIRTPRPDILDRPYAPDYSGESFRKQYKNPYPVPQNSINPGPQLKQPKPFSSPNRDIFLESESSHAAKPVHEQASNIIDDIKKTITGSKNDQVLATAESRTDTTIPTEKPALIVPPSKYYSPPFLEPVYNREYTEDVENNKVARTPADGDFTRRTFPTTTKSPYDRYDFKAFDSILKAVRKANREDYDFSKYIRNKDGTLTSRRPTQSKVVSKYSGFQQQATTKKNNLFTATQAPVKSVPNRNSFKNQAPSIQNPSGFGLGNAQTTFLPTTTARPQTTRTTTRPTTSRTTTPRATTTTTTTKRPVTTRRTTVTTTRRSTTTQRATARPRPPLSAIASPALSIVPPVQEPRPFAPSNSNKFSNGQTINKVPSSDSAIPPLALELLPPFEKEIFHDVATTVGPPIYYEWKSQVPASELLPPFENEQQELDNFAAHSQATRSVSGRDSTSFQNALEKLIKSNWTELRTIHSIPEYNFPLDREEFRTGYDNSERVNSFLLKIPDHNALNGREWYGENPKCPDCHPSFLKPGLCTPCIKIRE
uniref:CSON003794 protein n=1 Tax=Culicoides sonorensis TaxID=179676 RepID=A0A336MMM2_CULSO